MINFLKAYLPIDYKQFYIMLVKKNYTFTRQSGKLMQIFKNDAK